MGVKVHSLHFWYCKIYVYVQLLSAIMDTIINHVLDGTSSGLYQMCKRMVILLLVDFPQLFH
jgi:hypothetical protein